MRFFRSVVVCVLCMVGLGGCDPKPSEEPSLDLGMSANDLARPMLPDQAWPLDHASPDFVQTPDLRRGQDSLVVLQGTLEIRNLKIIKPDILVPRQLQSWEPFRTFDLCASVEGARVDRFRIFAHPSPDALHTVAVAHLTGNQWQVVGSSVPRMTGTDITLAAPVTVATNTCESFALWGKIAEVPPGQTGAPIDLVMVSGFVDQPWDMSYAKTWNINAMGTASASPIYVSGEPWNVSHSVVRKTKPLVTGYPIQNTTLLVGAQMDLRKWSVNADSAGNIYTRKVTFLFSAMLAQGSSLTLSNFGVRKGGTPIPMNDFDVRDGSGQDIKAGTWRAGVNNRFIAISFRNDLIAAAGQIGPVLTLYATVGEMLQPGDVLVIEFDKSVANHFSTGFLSGDQVMEGGLIGPHLDSGQKPGGPFSRSAFLWSDGSDFNSGRHWITEARVESFSSKQVLVR